MKLLVFGKTGQIGRALHETGAVLALGRDDVELREPGACASAIRHYVPDAVINAAAFTAVDLAEREEALATKVNSTAPEEMARACAALGIPFVHLSTDYVFDGRGRKPWRPDDQVSPVSAYGRSKLAGEDGVKAAGGQYVILRTSWVFSAFGHNFVKTILRLATERKELFVVADQIGGPTGAASLANACLEIVQQLSIAPAKAGVYHFAGIADVSWAEFAREVINQAGLPCVVSDILTSEYPTPARRPLNSRLDCKATEAVFGISRPEWSRDLCRVLAQISNE